MGIKKIAILFLILYILALLQTSFFVHFRLFGFVPNFIILLVIVFNILEKEKAYPPFGIICASIGGLLIDIFSSHFIGLYTLILIGTALFIKLVVKDYVRNPFGEGI